jgi:hypothetical protein
MLFLGATLAVSGIGLVARPGGKQQTLLLALTIFSLGAAFLPLNATRFLWQQVRSLDVFAFPWRWFGPASLTASLGAGLALTMVADLKPPRPAQRGEVAERSGAARARAQRAGVAGVGQVPKLPKGGEGLRRLVWALATLGLVSGVWQVAAWYAPRASLDHPSLSPESYRQAWRTTTMLDEYLPIGVRQRPSRPALQTFMCGEPARCREQPGAAYHRVADVETEGRAAILIQSFAFPGWEVNVDGRPVVPQMFPTGIMGIVLDPGRHQVSLDYQGTSLEHASLLVSGLAMVVALLLLLADVRRTRAGREHDRPRATQIG